MNKKIILGLALAALTGAPAMAQSEWSLGAGIEADDRGARTAGADLLWSPSRKVTFFGGAGSTKSDEDQGDFNSQSFSAGIEWWPLRRAGLALDYDTWSDSDSFEKNTSRATLYLGGSRARIGVIAESLDTETTAQFALLRRQAVLAFDGSGFGVNVSLTGNRVTIYASYVGYDYDDSVDRLLGFLSSPALTSRPRLEGLASSGLTVAQALLDHSTTLGADIYFGSRRVGLGLSQYRDLLTDSDTHVLQLDFEWPLTRRWSAQLTGGVSNSDALGTTYITGARFSVGSR